MWVHLALGFSSVRNTVQPKSQCVNSLKMIYDLWSIQSIANLPSIALFADIFWHQTNKFSVSNLDYEMAKRNPKDLTNLEK